jgi:hypothetical protein
MTAANGSSSSSSPADIGPPQHHHQQQQEEGAPHPQGPAAGSPDPLQQQQQQGAPPAPGPDPVQHQDCRGCRVTGLLLGLGGSAYIGSALWEVPPPRGAHRVTLVVSAAALAALGLYRAAGL